jgi:uncharacterized membrane protein
MPTIGVAMMFIQYMWESPFMIVIGVIVQYIKVRHKDKNSMRRAFFSLSTKSFHAELIVASIQ